MRHLDGLRGLAILAVVLFHCYSRGPDLPGLNTNLFRQGYLGVQLFFLLSGFLILHSLETSSSLGHFYHRRWLRLFPAMVAASWLIFVSAPFMYDRMDSLPGYLDALPGILFADPHWLRDWARLPVTGPIEGDFWTLFTEVKFYLLFGAAYFLVRRKAIGLLALLAVLGVVIYVGPAYGFDFNASLLGRAAAGVSDEMNARCYGWFAAGAFFYLYFDSERPAFLAASAGCAVLGIVASTSTADVGGMVFCTGVYLVFIAPFFWEPLKRLFCHPWGVFLGFISYPLYLLHQNISWSLAVKLHRAFPDVPAKLLMAGPVVLVGVLAWLSAGFIEPLGRQLLAWSPKSAAPSAPRPLGRDGRAGACALFAVLAALGVTAGQLRPVAGARRALESRILAEQQGSLDALEQKLADSRRALAGIHLARAQAQAYLESMKRNAP